MKGALIRFCLLIALTMMRRRGTAKADQSVTDDVPQVATTPDPLDCSFANLRTVIGHNDFSILGMLQNCAIFYAVGDNISSVNVSQIDGSPNRCQGSKPLFYRQNNGYRLFVAHKMTIYVGDCDWDNSSGLFLRCQFNRKQWKKESVKPTSNEDDMDVIGHATDLNTDILHVLLVDENGDAYDSMYNVSSQMFVRQTPLQEENLKHISYDSDLSRMYMLTEEMVYQKVHSDGGIFTYEPMHAEVNNFSRGSYSAFSFSNHFFLAKKMLSDGRVAYYAGVEGKPNQECIAETSPNEELSLTLFVGTGIRSAHERIRAQLSPKPELDVPNLHLTTVAKIAGGSASSSLSISLALLLLFLFNMRALCGVCITDH